MIDDKRFYGIYSGVVIDIEDPDKDSRIRLQVPQVLGEEPTEWARGCLPITSNSNHPDHKKHLASEVAALLQAHATHATHSETITSGPATVSTFGSHTHSVTISLAHDAHTNNHTGKTPDSTWNLDHEHEEDENTDNKWNDDQEQTIASTAEHTPHRLVPKLGQKVWVMFEGGDPNFPVWMGVEL
jgi:hypothetical protein